MSESPSRFAQLLTAAIRRIRSLEDKRIAIIQDELGYLLGRDGGSAIEFWRKEHLPPNLKDVEVLARALIKRAHLEQTWLVEFLTSAGHPAPERLCNELFASDVPTDSDLPSSSTPVVASPQAPPPLTELTSSNPISRPWPVDRLPTPGSLPPGSVMPLSRNPFFVGREPELLALAAALHREQIVAVAPLEIAAITGLGGMGKTQLASEFVHRYGQFFAGGVFWLSFEDANAISSEVALCGGAGAMELHQDFASRSLDEQVRLVRAAWQEPIARLLIFDNCEEPELLIRWRPTSGGCRVLITSRRADWELSLGVEVHALNVLSREESLQLLQKHKLNTSLALLDAIAKELGDLPLALHLAGNYLRRYRRVLTAEQYLAYLRDPALLSHPSLHGSGASPTGHNQHVARTFALSFERLDPLNELDARARQILVHMALLAPGEAVSYTLMAQTLGVNLDDLFQAIAMEDALVRLLELGLIDVHEERQLRIHRLLAAFVRASASELWQSAQVAVEALIQRILHENYEKSTPLELLPIQVHLRHVVESALIRHDTQGATLSQALAGHLWQLGEFAQAHSYTARALAIRQEICGTYHQDTASSHQLLGVLLQESSDFAEAHTHLQTALNIRLKLVGENHFDTADTLVNMGELFWAEQRIPEAIATLERALTICDEALEEDHPVIANITMSLALCLVDGGYDPQQARYYMQEALRIRRQVYGEEHVYTAIVYANMGYILHQTGQLDGASEYYGKSLVLHRQLLGEEHVDTANSLYCLGRLWRMQERWDEAQNNLERALKIFLEQQGEDYVMTASCLNELGAVYFAKQELAQAHTMLKRALAIRQTIYQADHPHVANTLQNLGLVLLAQSNTIDAERILLQALHTRQQARDPENMLVAETLHALGQVAESRGQVNKARGNYAQAFAIYQRHLGAANPATQKLAHCLSLLPANHDLEREATQISKNR